MFTTRIHRVLLVLSCLLFFGHQSAQSAPGVVNESFGNAGYATLGPDALGGRSVRVEAIAVTGDGRIVVAGWSEPERNEILIYRLLADGTLDPSFSGGAPRAIDIETEAFSPLRVLIQQDDRIVVGARTFVVRLGTDGNVDTTFGTGGRVDTFVEDLALLRNGELVVSHGWTISRRNSNGQIDATFGISGEAQLPVGVYGRSIAIQTDGNLLVAGDPDYGVPGRVPKFNVARLTSAGSVDTTFGSAGSVSIDIGLAGDGAFDLAVDSLGSILVAGYTDADEDGVCASPLLPPCSPDIALIRLLPNGQLDPQFGAAGIVTTSLDDYPLPPGSSRSFMPDVAFRVDVQPDGRIVVGGYPGPRDAFLVRYTESGALDTQFGLNGVVALALPPPDRGDTSGTLINLGFRSQFALHPAGSILALVPKTYLRTGQTELDYTAIASVVASDSNDDGIPEPWDVNIEPISFMAQSDVPTESIRISNVVQIAGLSPDVSVPLTVIDGEIAINSATDYRTGTLFVRNGDTATVRHRSATTPATTTTTSVRVGGLWSSDNQALTLGDQLSAEFTSATNADVANRAPVIEGGAGTFALREDATLGSVISTIDSSDPDGDPISFAIISGNAAETFALDSSGRLTLAQELDFESQANYELTIEVSDGRGGSTVATVSVEVSNVDESPPTNGGGGNGGSSTIGSSSGSGGGGGSFDFVFLCLVAFLAMGTIRSRCIRPRGVSAAVNG